MVRVLVRDLSLNELTPLSRHASSRLRLLLGVRRVHASARGSVQTRYVHHQVLSLFLLIGLLTDSICTPHQINCLLRDCAKSSTTAALAHLRLTSLEDRHERLRKRILALCDGCPPRVCSRWLRVLDDSLENVVN
jgi:hypothetical protein